MFSTSQKTINRPISCCGIGLHSGLKVNMNLLPAPVDSGIVFVRADVKDKNNKILANYKNVTDTNLGTTITNESGVKVSTIEHLMAAFWGYEIDNLIVELDSPEIPIMDGSSAPFIFLAECAGKCDQEVPRKTIEITKKVMVRDGDKYASLEPSKEFSISLDINFNHPQLGCQSFEFHPRQASFKNDISRARTFAFEKDIEKMHKIGLAKGGSLKNAIVIGETGIVNPEGLRMKDEFVRHKTLDFIGDIFLSGHYILGKFTIFKSGHELNNKLLHKLFEDKSSWRLV